MTTVVVSPPVVEPESTPVVVKVRRRGRVAAWLRRVGEKLRAGYARTVRATRNGLVRTWSSTKTAGSTTVAWVRRVASSSGRTAGSIGHRLARIGLSVGRGIGRTARFLGRSVRTFALAIPRSLARITGWIARVFSATFRTVLSSIWTITLAATIVLAVITIILAWTHDKYEERVHTHTRTWATGRKQKPWQKTRFGFGPASARAETGDWVNEAANRVGPWEAEHAGPETEPIVVTEEPVVITEEVAPETSEVVHVETHVPGPVVVPQEPVSEVVVPEEETMPPLVIPGDRAVGPVREDLTDVTVGDLHFRASKDLLKEGYQRMNWNMSGMLDPRYSEDDCYAIVQMFDLANHLKRESTKDKPVLELDLSEYGYTPTENQIFLNRSYWEGRMHVIQNWRLEEDEDPNERIDKSLLGMKMYWPIYLRDFAIKFESRESHKNQFKRGWDDQLKWYEEHCKLLLLTPEQRAEREAREATNAKKRGGNRGAKKV